MAGTKLLDLPTELLQTIFEHADWDRSNHLVPTRPDIFNISLTCQHLRRAVAPILFRNVSLKLRWVNGALAEPALLRLRQQCPHLAKYTRCIYVETLFGHFKDTRSKMKPFAMPTSLQAWLDSMVDVSASEATEIAGALLRTPQCSELLKDSSQDVQDRFHNLASSLTSQFTAAPRSLYHAQSELGDETFFDDAREEAISALATPASAISRVKSRDMRFQLDALFVLMLCFPPRLTSFVFESLPTDRVDTLQNQFALQIAALAFRVYGGQLKQLTVRSSPLRGVLLLSQGEHSFGNQSKVFTDVLDKLDAVRKLTISGHDTLNSFRLGVQNLGHWHVIADRITSLDLRRVLGDQEGYIDFIVKFTNLEHLTLGQADLSIPPPTWGQTRPSNASNWLSFLIELRRRLPNVEFSVQDLDLGSKTSLPVSGVRWLLEAAVPKGAKLDFERETRLMEDFESFLLLWTAEDSDRGQNAREARKDGRLVDLAMSSRWRGFKYVSD